MVEKKSKNLEIISPVFRFGSPIPRQYTCKGQNVSPPLNFFNVPKKTKSLALIMHDPDAPSGDFTHWLMWDIPTTTETIKANGAPIGAVQGPNGMGKPAYTGPCPPKGSGTHRYMFELYALDTSLGLDSSTDRSTLEKSFKHHSLAKARLLGTFDSEA